MRSPATTRVSLLASAMRLPALTAAIVGVNYGLRREDENTNSDTVKIFADVVNREQDNLVSIFWITNKEIKNGLDPDLC